MGQKVVVVNPREKESLIFVSRGGYTEEEVFAVFHRVCVCV